MALRCLIPFNISPKLRYACPPSLLQFQKKYGSLNYSTMAEPERITTPRTSIKNPGLHTRDHIGLWYTMEPDVAKRLLGGVSLTKTFTKLCETFQETSIMVREPALTVMDFVRRSDLSLPPNKLLFYGNNGVGKTMSVAHVLHFLSEDGWVIVHVPWAPKWRRNFREVTPSTTFPGGFDHPVDASVWLQHFKSQNSELLKEINLETTESYAWSRREETEAGSPIMALVEHGINRSRYASDAALALTTELKKQATEGRCKVALVVDGINSFFCEKSIHKVDNVFVEPQRFTIYKAFNHLFNMDWKNGCIVGSIDMRANDGSRRESHLPRYLLRQAGWETLDPFIPIPVENYNEREMISIVDYYVDHEWLPTVGDSLPKVRRELSACTNNNPQAIMNMCGSL